MKSIADLVVLLLFPCSFLGVTQGLEEDCVDYFGNIVSHGYHYVPGPSACTMCVCYHSQSLWCKAIYCQPPFFCDKFEIGEQCCEFRCLDSPEEIERKKDALRKRKRFFGIILSNNGSQLQPNLSTLTLSYAILSMIAYKKVVCNS